jgi:hypothetical protein
MPDRPTLPEPTGDQGAAQFRADLAAYLDSLFLHELADLLGGCSAHEGWWAGKGHGGLRSVSVGGWRRR